MFVPKCDRGIATFAAALREMESVGIPTRFPDTRDKSARGNRSLCPYRLQSTPRQWRSFRPCKSVPLFLLFVSFRVFRGLEVERTNFRSLGIHLPTKQTKKRQNFGGEDQFRCFFFSCHFVCFVG